MELACPKIQERVACLFSRDHEHLYIDITYKSMPHEKRDSAKKKVLAECYQNSAWQ